MSGRKLQNEIDKALKKVTEGVEEFEGVLEKLNSTANAAQREKHEQELKKEIKKLQRTRDQIKTWLGLSEIKDKRALLDNRKLIETQMERFKAIEKELKTKAFSKEGLGLPNKVDPEQARREVAVDWINEVVAKLNIQVDGMEAQQELLHAGAKRGKKGAGGGSEQLETLTKLIERHRCHIRKLEMILRALENEMVGADEIDSIRENVEYYIDSYQDVEEDNLDIYDDLGLDEEDELLGIYDITTPSHSDGQTLKDLSKKPDRSQSQDERDDEITPVSTPTPRGTFKAAQVSSAFSSPTKPTTTTTTTIALPTIITLSTTAVKPASISSVTTVSSAAFLVKSATLAIESVAIVTSALPVVLPPPPAGRYAAIAASAVNKDEKKVPKPIEEKSVNSISSPQPHMHQQASQPQELTPTRRLTTESDIQSTTIMETPKASQSKHGSAKEVTTRERSVSSQSETSEQLNVAQSTVDGVWSEPCEREVLGISDTTPISVNETSPQRLEQQRQERQPPQLTSPAENTDNRLPSSLADLVEVFQNAKNRAFGSEGDDNMHMQAVLDSTVVHAPDTSDSERLKHYTPQNVFPAPSYYPQQPPTVFENPLLYERLDTDTLFFIFYYQQGTYQQYLAARELKRQSWRFHKKYLTWFQRHEEPKSITDEYEQGTYIYFDYEGAWCQRKKTDFRFEYRFLEDAEMV